MTSMRDLHAEISRASKTMKAKPAGVVTKSTAAAVAARLQELSSPEAAAGAARFFKAGPGEYGEGDQFIGVRVPVLRQVARDFRTLPFVEVDRLLQSPIHEERLVALYVLVGSLSKCTPEHRQQVYDFYLERTDRVNNWDLVDSSAPSIVGGYLVDKPAKVRKVLDGLAKSHDLWQRRIAIVATQWLIRADQFDDTIRISERLLKDKHDLIHKAVGWMLREVGARHEPTLAAFLTVHSASMPRTMLRYAIEHYSPEQRRIWMG